MYKIATITLRPHAEDKDAQIDGITELLRMFYQNGQILDEYLLEDHGAYFVARVTATAEDSLDMRYANEFIRRALSQFEIDAEIVCDDALAYETCDCTEHGYLVLMEDPDASSPVFCGNCGREVPLIRLPYLFGEKEHYSILHFQEMYQSVKTLWISSLSDRFTKRQITDPKSALNETGREICRELEERTGTPVYYYLRSDLGSRATFWQVERDPECCPGCGGAFRFLSNGPADMVCDSCRLAFLKVPESSENTFSS